jgi:hypothetical protein
VAKLISVGGYGSDDAISGSYGIGTPSN